jgi:hypothetical protein
MRKPIIGLSSNYWGADEVGLTTKLGLPEQDWDMLGFIVTATAEDGLIEALECTGERFILAVQWHPEMMYERHGEQLEVFKRFVREAAGFRQKTATD